MTVLTLQNLQVTLGAKRVLSSIDLCVAAGEVIGVLGPNGAGKTSLLRAISADVHYQGSIELAGRPLPQWSLRERACHLAVLSQFSVLNFPYTVDEVVRLGRVPHATSAVDNSAVINEVVELLDIAHLRSALYTRLSGGEKRRVQLARVLAQIWRAPHDKIDDDGDDRLVLLDEPAAALDLLHRQCLLQVFARLRQQRIAAIVVEHDLNFAVSFADRLLALADGTVAASGSAEEVVTVETVRQLFHVDTTVMRHPRSGRPVVIN